MAILHGSWLPQNQGDCLFVWGETWRSLATGEAELTVLPHPLAMTAVELSEWVRSDNIPIANLIPKSPNQRRKAEIPIQSQIIALPTHISQSNNQSKISLSPIYSATLADENKSRQYLQPWQVEGFCLSPKQAITFLTSLPLFTASGENSFLGGDLRFWLQVARWCLDLISRCKFLPTIQQQEDTTVLAKWQALLDSSVDSSRLEKFAQLMPLVCRTYQINSEVNSVFLPADSQELLLTFINSTIDAQIREMLGSSTITLPSTLQQWLQGLTTASNIVKADTASIERLTATLKSWTMPLQYELLFKNQYRTCLELRPPELQQTDWTLAYFLQAADNPELMVDAATIWNHPTNQLVYENRTIKNPQETFLRGLGLASRLYSPIVASLETENPQFCHLNPTQAYEFIKSVAWRLEDNGLGVVLPPSLANRGNVANRLGLKITAQTSTKEQGRLGLETLLNFQWELAIGGQTISKAEFDRLVALNSPLVEINGEWVELRAPDIKTAQAFFSSRKDQMALSLEDALRLSSGDTQTIEKLPVVSFEASGALEELIGTLTNSQAIASLPTPASFQGQLRPYQLRGMAWLSFLERWGLGACLADDMGLGKTIEFIAFLLHLKEQNALEKTTLLVCPTSVLGNWEREVKKFAPTLKVLQYHGDKRPKGKAFLEIINKYDLVITSYSLIHRDMKTLQTISWQGIVLDEAQNVKNSEAKQSQAVRQLECSFRLAMTGTPVENRLQELWSIMDFLNPGYLGNRQFFQRRFAIPIEKYGDISSLGQLRSLVQPFILRRLKTDREIIQDLPEKQEMTVFCGLTSEQAELYQYVVEQSLADIEAASGIQRRGMILAVLVKLKQVCNHPAQYLKKDSLEEYNSGKLQRLLEMLDVALGGGDRALIFTQFAEWGKLLKPYLEKHLGKEIFFLYGSTSKKQREEMIDRFQHDPQGPPVMILSLKAGGVGLNLTRANHVFHFDRWWNPAVENQATDRVFRIGQTRNVQVHKFVCTGTLEEKIHDMIESKKQLAEQVVSSGEDWLTEMDTNQLRDLLLLDRDAIIDEDEDEG